MASDPRRELANPDAPGAAPRRAANAETYLPLVRRIAMKLARSLPSNIAVDDIISAGWVGLSESLKRCPPGMSDSDFEAYASYRVRGAILDYLRTLDPLTRKLRTASRRISQAIGDLAQSLGRVPEEDEVAGALGVTLDAYRDLLREIGEAGFARLDIDMVDASSGEPSPEANVMKRNLAARVTEAIEQLPERLQLVLALHYQEECTLKDIGAVLGVTESRACQLHSEAVQHIRALVERPNLPRLAKNGARRRPTAV
ncbi:MAG TPA: FliA/WhiG family RNA polymerase sigma factor [Polyangiaceae bacterium]